MIRERASRRHEKITEPGKGNLYLLTGLVIGLLLGLVISWVILPVKFVDTDPSSLRGDFKDDFRLQIASAYHVTNNLARAQARLALLGDPDSIQALTFQAQTLLTEGDPTGKAFILAYLADAIKTSTSSTAVSTTLSSQHSITSTMTQPGITLPPNYTKTSQIGSLSTPTLQPSITPIPTQEESFILKSNQVVCDLQKASLFLMVEVYNSSGEPIPGSEIIITWPTGEEQFFTGLQPEMGLGYADYLMTPNTIYGIRLGAESISVSNLVAPNCSFENGKIIWGGLKLIFTQPKN
jgi:hypothetical protein